MVATTRVLLDFEKLAKKIRGKGVMEILHKMFDTYRESIKTIANFEIQDNIIKLGSA